MYRTTIDPIDISRGDLAYFFLHMFDRAGLTSATIHTYKAVLLLALEPRQPFSASLLSTLIKLLNSFLMKRPPKPSTVPTGDIGVVLKAFLLAPFEPICQASVKSLTFNI